MRKMLFAALLFLGLSCSSRTYKASEQPTDIRPNPITANVLDNVKYACGRFEWWLQNPTDPAQRYITSWGTAWCLAIDRELGTSLWITCGHVAEETDRHETGFELVPELKYKDIYGRIEQYPIHKINVSKSVDASFFLCEFIPYSKLNLELDVDKTIKQMQLGHILLLAGCPENQFPPTISIGYFLHADEDDVFMTNGSWNGGSGGPLYDPISRQVIGILYEFCSVTPKQSDNIKALSAVKLRDYLLEQGKN